MICIAAMNGNVRNMVQQSAIAELGASLGIGSNATGIIIGCPGDEAWGLASAQDYVRRRASPFCSVSHGRLLEAATE